jgi:hypothetical protein
MVTATEPGEVEGATACDLITVDEGTARAAPRAIAA